MAVIPPGDERIPASRVPLSDIETIAGKSKGIITKEWFRYLQAVFRLVLQGGNTTSIQDLLISPGNISSNAHTSRYAYGSFRSSQNQFVGMADEAYPIEFDEEVAADGVRVEIKTTQVTASSVTTTLTVITVLSGQVEPGLVIAGVGITPNTRIIRQISGSPGGAGTYELDTSNTFSSQLVTGLLNSQLRVYRTGVYSIQVTYQIVSTDIVDQQIDLWLRVNNANLAASNVKVTAHPNDGSVDGYTPVTLTFGVQLGMGDLLELVWSTTDVAAALVAVSAAVSPTRPLTPSVAAIVSMVSVPTLQSAAA